MDLDQTVCPEGKFQDEDCDCILHRLVKLERQKHFRRTVILSYRTRNMRRADIRESKRLRPRGVLYPEDRVVIRGIIIALCAMGGGAAIFFLG